MTHPRFVKRARSKRRRTRKGPYSAATLKLLPSPHSKTTMKELPRDMLVEVLATVASNSFTDLYTMKKCCKDFLDAAEDRNIWRRISLDTFPLIHWVPNEKVSWFLNRCMECGNIESLFREGLRKFFNPDDKIDGVEILKEASEKGHKEAKYVYGMILLGSKDDDLRKQGLEHVRLLRKSKCVVSCRNKVKGLLDSMWKNNVLLELNRIPLCHFKSTCKGCKIKTGRWVLVDDEDDDLSLCEYCRWDQELEFFHHLFNVH